MSSAFCTNLDIPHNPFWHNTLRMTENYIKEIRTAQGLTQEELAEKLGTQHAQVQRHESGKRKLSWDWIKRYSEALGCHPMEITDGPGVNTSPIDPAEEELLNIFREMDEGAKQMYLHTLRSFNDVQKSDGKDKLTASPPLPTFKKGKQ